MDRPFLTTKTHWHIGFDPNIGPLIVPIKLLWNRLGNKFSYRLLGTNGQKPTVCDENDKYPIRPNHAVFDGSIKKTNVFILHVECHLYGIWELS